MPDLELVEQAGKGGRTMHNKWRWLALAAIVAVVHFWGRMIEERVFEVVWPVGGPVLFY